MILRALLLLVSLVLLAVPLWGQGSVSTSMLKASRAFLATLTPEQKARSNFPFNSDERFRWFYTPVSRKGIPLKEMTELQKKAAMDLLRAGLSEKGYTKAETIRSLEDVLREVEQGSGPTRDTGLYFFTFFGEPSESTSWGWRYEGHHLSQNWTIVNGKSVSAIGNSPQFFGANPAEVRSGPLKGKRALAGEEDLGRSIVKSLKTVQRSEAVLSGSAPSEILTSNQRKAAIEEDKGIAYAKLDKEQQGLLLALIEEYLNAQPRALAQARLKKIRDSGLNTIKFAWIGGLEKGEGHYYRVQGKTFLIEYDNTQNDANHIHCVWRDFTNDWGEDLLAEHYRSDPHDQHAHNAH
jgi:hypothetical protein